MPDTQHLKDSIQLSVLRGAQISPREMGEKSHIRIKDRQGTSLVALRLRIHLPVQGLPDGSAGKESTCNAGDPGSIPGSGRSTGEWLGYPLQYSWASLVAQLVKNPPAAQETWVRSLRWEDPLEKGKATHSSIPAWRIPWTIQRVAKSQT